MSLMAETIRRGFLLVTLMLAVGVSPAAAGQSVAKKPAYIEVPVPSVMIYAGRPISSGVLTTRRIAARYLARGAFAHDPSELEGKLARSTLVPGHPIAVSQVREPDVINASRPVKMIYRSGPLVITGEVIPLQSAGVGERVRARNVATGIVVSGVAQADGSLLVAGN